MFKTLLIIILMAKLGYDNPIWEIGLYTACVVLMFELVDKR